jgi:transposase
LEDHGFRLLLVNPAQVKALEGRKSDGRDARRIAEYLQDGRLDASFVPPQASHGKPERKQSSACRFLPAQSAQRDDERRQEERPASFWLIT